MTIEDKHSIAKVPSYIVPTSPGFTSLYTYLPSAVKSRIPRLKTLRRTIRWSSPDMPTHGVVPQHSTHTFERSSRSAGSVTELLYQHPFIGHGTELVTRDQYFTLTNVRPDSPESTACLTDASSAPSSRPVTPQWNTEAASSTQNDTTDLTKHEGDVPSQQLIYAHPHINPAIYYTNPNLSNPIPAISLLTLATRPTTPPDLSRLLTLDAIYYLLRILPSDLSDHEIHRISSSLPPQVLTQSISPSPKSSPLSSSTSPTESKFLRSTISLLLTNLFLLLALILPQILRLATIAYSFERRHQLSERLLVLFLGLLTTLGEKGIDVETSMERFGRSKTGKRFLEWILGTWLAVVGGLRDGLGEGMGILIATLKECSRKEERNERTDG